MRSRNKPWALPFLKAHPIQVYFEPPLNSLLLEKSELTLEIGVGKGDYLVALAHQNPDKFYLGFEKDKNVAALAFKKILEAGLNNVALVIKDASNLLEWLKNNQIEIIYLNFSDPWPKRRNQKRRLTHESFLKQYQQILAKDGKIVMKTDNVDLYEYSLNQFQSYGFVIESSSRDFRKIDFNDPWTEYERKFVELGKPIYQVVVRK